MIIWDVRKEKTMITLEMVANAYKKGVVKLEVDPNLQFGTVAKIGDFWFYFGGLTAEEMNPDDFIENIPEEHIVKEIFETLNDFRFEGPNEYDYYEAALSFND